MAHLASGVAVITARRETPGLQLVIDQAERYKLSVHSRPNADEPTQKNASCAGCHDSHTFARG